MALLALPWVFALLTAMGLWDVAGLQRLEAFLYDSKVVANLGGRPDPRIVIIDIDEASLGQVGQWPWSRDKLEKLVQVLFMEQGLAVLGMDVVFAEKDDSSGLDTLQSLAQGPLRGEAGFQKQLQALAPSLDFDRRFGDALNATPSVLGYYFSSQERALKTGVLPEPVLDRATLQQRRFRMTQWQGHGSNIAAIADGAPVAGFFNPIVDADGVVRSLPLLAEFDGQAYESLALAMYRTLLPPNKVVPVFPTQAQDDYPHITHVGLRGREVQVDLPVDSRAAVLVPFRGRGGPQAGTYQYIPAADVLAGRLAPDQLKDKIAFLGTTAIGLVDQRATPVSEVYPGVEAHANVLSAMLDRNMPAVPDYAVGFNLLQIGVVGLMLIVLLPQLTALWSSLLSLTVIAWILIINTWLHWKHNVVMPMGIVLLTVVGLFILNTLLAYIYEGRNKRHLATLFGTYVPPELVDKMVEEPERYSMQAQDRELTVLFSDMRGFTTLSEALTPDQLQTLLNKIFSRLTEEIRQQRGTIDKYIGDCVMAFWGAPVHDPDHAKHAVLASMAMQKAVEALNLEFQAEGLPYIGMGVGLNTGTMFVGDMGSDLRRSYTVIGDAVNLGSRLEGVSKFYGLNFVCSEATRLAAGDDFIWQELDKVRVKGKEHPVVIFTCWGLLDALSPALRDELKDWADFLQAWRAQDWLAARPLIEGLHQAHPDKELYTLYLERVDTRAKQPPLPNWDGSTTFFNK